MPRIIITVTQRWRPQIKSQSQQKKLALTTNNLQQLVRLKKPLHEMPKGFFSVKPLSASKNVAAFFGAHCIKRHRDTFLAPVTVLAVWSHWDLKYPNWMIPLEFCTSTHTNTHIHHTAGIKLKQTNEITYCWNQCKNPFLQYISMP